MFAHAGGETEMILDWALAEWTFNRHFKLRAGKIKQPVALYSETLEVGATRPFFDLPQSVYGSSGVLGEAFLGGGLTGEVWANDDWTISYDLYAGQVDLEITEPWEQIEAEEHEEEELEECIDEGIDEFICEALAEAGEGGGHSEHEELSVKAAFGWRLNLDTPVEGLSFGFSGFLGDIKDGRDSTIGVQALYALDWGSVRAEYFHTKRDNSIEWDAAYIEGAFRPFLLAECGPDYLEGVEIAVRYDWLDGKSLGEKIDSRYRSHEEVSFGVNYWFSPGFVLKASYHHVNGNMYAFDIDQFEDGTMKKTTDTVTVGVHFAF